MNDNSQLGDVLLCFSLLCFSLHATFPAAGLVTPPGHSDLTQRHVQFFVCLVKICEEKSTVRALPPIKLAAVSHNSVQLY